MNSRRSNKWKVNPRGRDGLLDSVSLILPATWSTILDEIYHAVDNGFKELVPL